MKVNAALEKCTAVATTHFSLLHSVHVTLKLFLACLVTLAGRFNLDLAFAVHASSETWLQLYVSKAKTLC